MPFCEEHSEVMKCLGALEQGQSDMKITLASIDTKLTDFAAKQANSNISAAEERVKSRLLYWVIGIAVAALITGLVNFSFHVKEVKNGYATRDPKAAQTVK